MTWLPRVTRQVGGRDPDTLATRAEIAYWTGESGHPERALQLHRELLPDQVEVLGARHANTLTTRTGGLSR
jgi:hypothetical protein